MRQPSPGAPASHRVGAPAAPGSVVCAPAGGCAQFAHLFCGAANKYFTGRAMDWPTEKLLARLRQAAQVEKAKLPVLAALAKG